MVVPSFEIMSRFSSSDIVIFWSPYLVALSRRMSSTCKRSCFGKEYSVFELLFLKMILPENFGLKISMRCDLGGEGVSPGHRDKSERV